MVEFLVVYLPWLLSLSTIYMLYLAGNKNKNSWLVSIGNQFLWLTWIILSGSWGLILGNLALWYVSTRNYFKWRKEEKE